MTTRIKASNTIFTSKIEFENAIDQAASLQLKLEREIAEYNEQKAAADKAFKSKVKNANAKINELVIGCESYAAHHRDSLTVAQIETALDQVDAHTKELNKESLEKGSGTFIVAFHLDINRAKEARDIAVLALDPV